MHFSAATIFTAIDKFSEPVRRMQNNTDKFAKNTNSSIGKLNQTFSRMGREIIAAGSFISAGAVVAIATKGITDFDQSIQSLSAVTGVTGPALENMKKQVMDLANKSGKSGAEVAKSFEIVGSAMSQYLDNPEAMGKIADAGITLSKASKMDLEPALVALTGAMNQFNMSADKAQEVINNLTAGEIVGQISTAKSVEELSKFGAVANSMNVSLPESIALIQTLGKKLPAQEIGTAARNLLLFMDTSKGSSKEALDAFRRNGVNLNILSNKALSAADRFKELSKVQNDSVAMIKIFGKENVTAGKVIFDQLGTYKQWAIEIGKTQKAEEQAKINSAAFNAQITRLKNTFINYAIGVNDSTGSLTGLGRVIGFITDHLGAIIKLLTFSIGLWLAYRALMYTAAAATWVYNTALDFQLLLQGYQGTMLLKGRFAMIAYAVAMKAVTFATWLWNAALAANPVVLITIAIVALIASIVLLIVYWDKVKAKMDEWSNSAIYQLFSFMSPLAKIIELIAFFQDRWEGLKKAFSTGGMLAGLKAIGLALISFFLKPLEVILASIGKLTGSEAFKGAAIELKGMRAGLDEGLIQDKSKAQPEPVNKDLTIFQRSEQNNTTTSHQKVQIQIDDSTGNARLGGQLQPVPIVLNNTKGYGL